MKVERDLSGVKLFHPVIASRVVRSRGIESPIEPADPKLLRLPDTADDHAHMLLAPQLLADPRILLPAKAEPYACSKLHQPGSR